MIAVNIFGALVSLVVMINGVRDRSTAFVFLGAALLAFNVWLGIGSLS